MSTLVLVSCDPEDGLDGLDGVDGADGINGLDGQDGQDGLDGQDGDDARPPQTATPFGFTEVVWNDFILEDRRTNTDPGDIGIGEAQLVRDENGYFFFELSSFNTTDAAGTQFNVYNTVAGASLDAQNGFAESERPRLVMNLDNTAPAVVTVQGNRIFIPLTTPPGPADSGRMFDWIVLYPVQGADTSRGGIVADLDAANAEPRRQVWNPFLIEDRTLDAASITTNNGTARLVTNADAGRTNYWVELDGFQNVGEPIVRGNGSIVAQRFAVFMTVAGAPLGAQLNFERSEAPVFLGILETNGNNDQQYVPTLLGDVADLTANNGRGIDFSNLNQDGITTNAGGYVIPQRAAGGQQRFYDWFYLMPIDGQGVRPIGYAGLVADLDASRELSQNQSANSGL